MDDIKSLIPKHKADFERLDKNFDLGYSALKPILPELLEWIQDMDWSIAQKLAHFLLSIGIDIIPEIKRIMKIDDYIWQYACLSEIVQKIGKDAIVLLEEDLKRIRDNPKEEEKSEYLHGIAKKLLKMV